MIAAAGLTLERPGPRAATFFFAYLGQGLVAGFSLTALVNHYASLGFSVADVGRHFALVGLPWVAQPFLWGPLVDRAPRWRMGRRRGLALLSLVGAHLALGVLFLVPDYREITLVSAVFLGHSVFASLTDTAVDRMILDHVPEGERGRVSAWTRAGLVTGTAFGGTAFSWTLAEYGFGPSVVVLIASSLAAATPLLVVREASTDAWFSLRRLPGVPVSDVIDAGWRRYLADVAGASRRPAVVLLLAACFAIEFTTTAFDVRLAVTMVQDAGWDPGALSRLQSALALASGTLGAAAVGLWSDRSGEAVVLRAFFRLTALAYVAAAALFALGLSGVGGIVLGLSNVVPALLYVALVPRILRLSEGPTAATQFELYMAALNLGDVAGAGAAEAIGTALTPLGTALVTAGVFAALPRVLRW